MKTVLITGGSSGIGYELSRLFAANGYNLLWVSVNEDELLIASEKIKMEFHQVIVQTLVKDLSLLGSAKEVYEWSKKYGAVNVLVNNAGFGTYGFLHDIPEEKELAMLHLNIVSVYQLTRYFMKDMIVRNEGRIMNISSNSALQPVPMMAAYASTKAFIKHFSQSLSDELKYKNSKVTITTVCPPATTGTGFQKLADMENVKTFSSILTSTPSEVANYAYKGTMAGEELVLAGKNLRNLNWLYKVLPTGIIKKLLKQELQKNK